MRSYLEFEKPVADLEGKVQELKILAEGGEAVDVEDEIARLQEKANQALSDVYSRLTPWQKNSGRPPPRPSTCTGLHQYSGYRLHPTCR